MRMKVLHVYSGNLFGGIESMLLACARVPVKHLESSPHLRCASTSGWLQSSARSDAPSTCWVP